MASAPGAGGNVSAELVAKSPADGLTLLVQSNNLWLWQFVQGPDKWPRSIKGRAQVWPPLRYSIFNTLRLAGIATIVGIGFGLMAIGFYLATRWK